MPSLHDSFRISFIKTQIAVFSWGLVNRVTGKWHVNLSKNNFSPKLKGLLHERVNKDKINGIGRLYMQSQLRYQWLNCLVSKNQWSQSMNSPKLKGSLLKLLDIDEINGTERPNMQSNQSWQNSFVNKNQESAMDEKKFNAPLTFS